MNPFTPPALDSFPRGDGSIARLIRAAGFAPAGLGPVSGWSQSLRWAVQLMLDSGPATALLWGPDRTLLYNDTAAGLLGPRHPALFGQPLGLAWPDLPADVAGVLASVLGGQPVGVGAAKLNMLRSEGLAEVTMAVSMTPLREDGGWVAGLLATGVETGSALVSPRAIDPSADAAPRLTVLLVEDDPLILDSMASQLSDAGHHVVAAASSEEAVATLAAHSVDVLLTDLNLPGASGATLAATARRLRPEVGIVLATGDQRGAAHVAVPHRLLPKPFTPAELIGALADFRPLPPPEPTVWITERGD